MPPSPNTVAPMEWRGKTRADIWTLRESGHLSFAWTLDLPLDFQDAALIR